MRDRQVYIGIDTSAGRRPCHIAVLDAELRFINQTATPLRNVIKEVEKYPLAICAVDAPMGPNLGLLTQADIRTRHGLPPNGSKWAQFKLSEYELRRRGIALYNTPTDTNSAPSWMQAGWKLYEQLRVAGFVPYHPEHAADLQMCEVHPHASYSVMLGRLPFKKTSLEGRLQRQLLLYEENVDVADAMVVFEEITRNHLLRSELALDGLLLHDELDALIAALTAFYAGTRTDEITMAGDREEGQIVIPVETLKERYV